MSGQYGQKKKQPRGGNSANYAPQRQQRPPKNQEKSVLSEGIYRNELFMFNTLSVIGSTVKIYVKNGRIYEGIFRTLNSQLDIVVDNVHVVEGSKLPCRENIIPLMVFHWKDIVSMNLSDVNMEYAILGGDGCADASTSGRHNGRAGERELQPWVNADDGSEIDSLSLDDLNSNGWPANCMFETNESKFNYKSNYDPSLKEYTTELHRADTEEYRNREAEAERHAQEILTSSAYSESVDLENGDEEMLFSAVHRPEDVASGAAPPAGNGGGKYVVPHHRNAQPSAALAQRPQQLFVMAPTQADAARGQHPATVVPAVMPTVVDVPVAAAVVSSSSGVIRVNATAGEMKKDDGDRPHAQAPKASIGNASVEHAPDNKQKTSAAAAGVDGGVKIELQKPRADTKQDTIQELKEFGEHFKVKGTVQELKEFGEHFKVKGTVQELKEFGEHFKLPDSAAEHKDTKHAVAVATPALQTVTSAPTVMPVALPQPQRQQTPAEPGHLGFQEEKAEEKEDAKEDISIKSILNPTAKEFVPSVKTYGTLRSLPSQTPPRPPSTVGSPVFVPYIQQNAPVYHTTIMAAPPSSIQQSRNTGVSNKRASVSVSGRPDINPPPQAMTGAPLITQQVMIPGPMVPGHGGLAMMSVHQPLLRMIPQHHQNVVLDPNQPVFAVPMASSLTSHQHPHPGSATHHVIAGGAMHVPHGAAGITVAPPQQTSGAPTPTPVHQYGQPPQPGSTMAPLPTTSGTPQPPAQIQMFPGGQLAMSHHHQQIHPVSLQHINNPASPIIYQTPGGMMQFPQFPHQTPGLAYATAAAPGVQQPGQGQMAAGQQSMGASHQQPPPAMGPSSHVVVHGPQMVMGPQGQGAYMGMQVPVSMTQAPGLAQHPVAAFHMYSVPGAGPTFAFSP